VELRETGDWVFVVAGRRAGLAIQADLTSGSIGGTDPAGNRRVDSAPAHSGVSFGWKTSVPT
jgi:hypothetical protein